MYSVLWFSDIHMISHLYAHLVVSQIILVAIMWVCYDLNIRQRPIPEDGIIPPTDATCVTLSSTHICILEWYVIVFAQASLLDHATELPY